MNEEEFEDMLGVKHGWPEPLGMPRRPILIPLIIWLGIVGAIIVIVLKS